MDFLARFIPDAILAAGVATTFSLFVAEFASGVAKAIKSGHFSQLYIANILQSQGPAVLVIIVFSYLAGTAASPIGVLALGAVATYAISAQKSIRENLAAIGIPVLLGNNDVVTEDVPADEDVTDGDSGQG